MAFYHINNDHKSLECSSPDNCKFGTPKEGHFTDSKEAEAEAYRQMTAKYGVVSQVTRSSKTSGLKSLQRSGFAVKRIQSVESFDFYSGDFEESTVDVLDEKPSTDFLNGVSEGRILAFA